MRRGAEEYSGGGGGEAEDGAGGGEGEAGTQGEAGGGEIHEVFDVVEVGGESEEELWGEREEAGWVGHGSSVVDSTSFTCYPLAIYSTSCKIRTKM